MSVSCATTRDGPCWELAGPCKLEAAGASAVSSTSIGEGSSDGGFAAAESDLGLRGEDDGSVDAASFSATCALPSSIVASSFASAVSTNGSVPATTPLVFGGMAFASSSTDACTSGCCVGSLGGNSFGGTVPGTAPTDAAAATSLLADGTSSESSSSEADRSVFASPGAPATRSRPCLPSAPGTALPTAGGASAEAVAFPGALAVSLAVGWDKSLSL
mmetsp:Transcript_13413/g.38281  ORF Transcript_13413/g.38281 Transcript_13413/m.38281 type:complete len:217 (-) Transcript_13413:602-1252(-)